jgi:hypothetical protein
MSTYRVFLSILKRACARARALIDFIYANIQRHDDRGRDLIDKSRSTFISLSLSSLLLFLLSSLSLSLSLSLADDQWYQLRDGIDIIPHRFLRFDTRHLACCLVLSR